MSALESLPFQYRKQSFWEFYCPICKQQRRSYYWPSPRLRHYVALAVLGLTLTAGLWTWTGIRGAFLVLPVWAVFEFFYRARARHSLVCPHCGFDPYLYKKDVKRARQKVEEFFADKQQAREEKKKALEAKKAAAAKDASENAPVAGKPTDNKPGA